MEKAGACSTGATAAAADEGSGGNKTRITVQICGP
jgi:hypothetical protein